MREQSPRAVWLPTGLGFQTTDKPPGLVDSFSLPLFVVKQHVPPFAGSGAEF